MPTTNHCNPNAISSGGFHFSELDSTIQKLVLPLRDLVAANGESLYVNLVPFLSGGVFGFTACTLAPGALVMIQRSADPADASSWNTTGSLTMSAMREVRLEPLGTAISQAFFRLAVQ